MLVSRVSPPHHAHRQDDQKECHQRRSRATSAVIETSVDLETGGFDALLAVVAVVDPPDKFLGAEVLVAQPFLQGAEIFT